VVTVIAGSGTDGLPQPFLQPVWVMLEIKSGEVMMSIALMSILRHLTGFEQIRGLRREVRSSERLQRVV
jgi:hypothetical protein